MKPFLFLIRVRPMPGASLVKDVAGANATVIAFKESVDEAQKTSVNFLNRNGWVVEEIEVVLKLQQQQIACFDAVLRSVYQKAELNGISAHFDAWQHGDRPGEHSVESLRNPSRND